MSAQSAVMRDGLGPMQRWELARGEVGLAAEVFERLTQGDAPETLEQIAKSRGLPRGVFVRWFSTEHRELLDAAEKVLGLEVAHLVRAMTDGATVETLGLMKFKTDRYLRLAEMMNGERYARKQEVKHSGLSPVLVIEIAGGLERAERVVAHAEQIADDSSAHEMI